jgi:sec-independent protein translocase protein TatB
MFHFKIEHKVYIMFGMGFTEIFLILVVAIIALGPEKLPNAAVEIARFFKKIKGGVEDAKATLDNELNLSEMKSEVDNLKSSLDVDKLANIDLEKEINKVATPSKPEESQKVDSKKEESKA